MSVPQAEGLAPPPQSLCPTRPQVTGRKNSVTCPAEASRLAKRPQGMTIGVGGLDGQGWEAELESASRQGVGEPWAGLQWPGSQRKGGDFFFSQTIRAN